jgi:hypothetical protein
MPSSTVRTFTDPDAFQAAIRHSHAEGIITGRDQFRAELTLVSGYHPRPICPAAPVDGSAQDPIWLILPSLHGCTASLSRAGLPGYTEQPLPRARRPRSAEP